jgi:HSP20 family protein
MNTEISKQEAPLSKVRQQRYIRPYYEIDDLEHAYEVKVHLPGVGRDKASVTLDKDTLVVEADRTPHWNESLRAIHREIPDADYRLRLQLNVLVDGGKISAKSKDGILTIYLPVSDEAKPRTISVK